jgi:hypothetical protein
MHDARPKFTRINDRPENQKLAMTDTRSRERAGSSANASHSEPLRAGRSPDRVELIKE